MLTGTAQAYTGTVHTCSGSKMVICTANSNSGPIMVICTVKANMCSIVLIGTFQANSVYIMVICIGKPYSGSTRLKGIVSAFTGSLLAIR